MTPELPPAKHIRLTSHPVEGRDLLPIEWGKADPRQRGTLAEGY